MNDQNKQMMDELMAGLNDEQKAEFQKLAQETVAARVLDHIIAVLSDEEIEEMKALPEDDPSAMEVFIHSKFSKEEIEEIAKEELFAVRERMKATIEGVNNEMQADEYAQEVVDSADLSTDQMPGGPQS